MDRSPQSSLIAQIWWLWQGMNIRLYIISRVINSRRSDFSLQITLHCRHHLSKGVDLSQIWFWQLFIHPLAKSASFSIFLQFKQRGIETVRRPTFLTWRLRHIRKWGLMSSSKNCCKQLAIIGPDLLSSSIFVCLFRWTKSNCLYRMYHWVPQWGALLMPGERHRSRLRALISTITHLFD